MKFGISLIILFNYFVNCYINSDNYYKLRAKLINDEEHLRFGNELKFRKNERVVNEYLMSEKQKEIDKGKNLIISILLIIISSYSF